MAATVSFGTKFQLNQSPKTFRFNDSTDYAGQGLVIADFRGVIKITDPTGTVSYNNTNYAAPDINPSVSLLNTTTIPIPLDSDGNVLKGDYIIRYSIQNQNTLEISYSEVTIDFEYESPTVSIALTSNCVMPLLKSVDNTVYSVDGVTPTISRTHTIFYPAVLQLAPLVGTGSTVQTSTFYTEQHSSKVESDLTYVFSDHTVTDTIEGSETIDVDCDAQLCDIYCCMSAEFSRYLSFRASNTTQANIYLNNWIRMMGLATMIRIALECGKEADINSYTQEILTLGNCQPGCGCQSGAPVPVIGLGGLSSANVAVAQGTGITVTSNTVGNVTTYTVSITSAFVDKINNSYNTVVAAGTNITSVTVSTAADGTKTYTVNAAAPAVVDMITLELRVQYQSGAVALFTETDRKITGTLFKAPTYEVENSSLGYATWKNIKNGFIIKDFLNAITTEKIKSVAMLNKYTINLGAVSFSSQVNGGNVGLGMVNMDVSSDGEIKVRFFDTTNLYPTGNTLEKLLLDATISVIIHR